MSALAVLSKLPVEAPWWAYLVVIFACLAVYICRIVFVYKLGSKALDKVDAGKVPEIMNAVTGYKAKPPTKP